jgi:hypothetical protein
MEIQEHFFVIGKTYKISIDITNVPVWSNKIHVKNEYIGILYSIPCIKIPSCDQILKEIKYLEDLNDLPKYENGNNRAVQLIIIVDNEKKLFIFNGPLPNSYITIIKKIE